MGIPADDPVVAALRARWMSLDAIDSLTARPLELRTALLSLYYADLLERQNIGDAPAQGDPAPVTKLRYTSSDSFPSALDSPAQAEVPPAAPAPRPSAIIPAAAAPHRPKRRLFRRQTQFGRLLARRCVAMACQRNP